MTLFIACHCGIDRAIWLADERAVVGVGTLRLIGRCHGYTKRTASLATHVVHPDVSPIID